MTRLVVVSHTPHHLDGDSLRGWGPTVRELDHLATLVDELVHVAPVHPGDAPAEARPYQATNVRVVPVRAAGGGTLDAKLGLARAVPTWATTIWREANAADAVHVRAPANIAAVALAVLSLRSGPRVRWVKYAGEWGSRPGEPLSYALQRRFLAQPRAHRSTVTVNAAASAPHVRSFVNPALDSADLERGRAAASRRSDPAEALRLLFVGRLERDKRVEVAASAVTALRAEGTRCELDVVGDGGDRRAVDGLDGVRVHGWLPRERVDSLYAAAHVLLVPSTSEGFPKVIAEAAAYGVVPVVADVGGVRAALSSGWGTIVPRAAAADAYAEAVKRYLGDPHRWRRESTAAIESATRFTYDAYVEQVRQILGPASVAPR